MKTEQFSPEIPKDPPGLLLEQAAKRFNIEDISFTYELHRVLEELQNYATSQEQSPLTIEITDDDPDFNRLPEWLDRAFGEELLNKAYISRITIREDIVHLNIGKGLYLTKEQYADWAKENPSITTHKVRAENFTTFVSTGWTKQVFDVEQAPLPILIYSFIDENPDTLEYLNLVSDADKMRLYKLGTVSHEIGHHLYTYLLTDEEKSDFESICQNTSALTLYSEGYSNKEVFSEEKFCEAIRLLTTNREFLESKAPKLFLWITQKFPDITQVT